MGSGVFLSKEYPLMKSLILFSFKRNLIPGVTLWFLAVGVLLSYFYWSPARDFLDVIKDLKSQYGYLYSGLATGVFGGLIPFAIQRARGEYRSAKRFFSCLLFFFLFWVWKGVEIDAFYRLQGVLWGTDNHWTTIAKKVAFDMSVFSALYAVPCIAIFNVWKDQFFNFTSTKRVLTKSFFKTQVVAMIVSNCMVWIPAVSVVYAMPDALQVVMFNLVLCFWVLIASMLSVADQSECSSV